MSVIIDCIVVALLLIGAYSGYRLGLIRQAVVTVGSFTGLCVAALGYRHAAFLAQGIGGRAVIAVMLLLAALFFSCSAVLTAATWAELRWHLPIRGRAGRLGAVLGLVTTGFVLWAVVVSMTPALSAGSQRAIARSVALGAVERIVGRPAIIKQIATSLNTSYAPVVFQGGDPAFNGAETAVDQTYTSLDSAIAHDKPAVFKVQAWGCGGSAVGSGFLVSPRLIFTNAHVIAGAERITVQSGDNTYSVVPVWFDPKLDDAVLVTQIDAGTPLSLQTKAAPPGAVGAVLGYPGGNSLTSQDAVILQLLTATGNDIYGVSKTMRDVYALRSSAWPGSSGGPLIDASGAVRGLVFGNSTTEQRTVYAIAANQLQTVAASISPSSPIVATGPCLGE
ncbi:MAG TPA: CvpA family protein [Candidatus Saccharimonadales bacterium]|nr:CvpA family protein [Candidatus Saccharimonadales bacterium]